MNLRPTVAWCSACGVRIVGWRRRPCRKCGATARTFVRAVSDHMTSRDQAG